MKKVELKEVFERKPLLKKTFFLVKETWIYALLFICFSMMFKPVVTEVKFRAEVIEKSKDSEETDLLQAMPFPLLPALQVPETSARCLITLCLVCGKI